jgi:hypothetical protein
MDYESRAKLAKLRSDLFLEDLLSRINHTSTKTAPPGGNGPESCAVQILFWSQALGGFDAISAANRSMGGTPLPFRAAILNPWQLENEGRAAAAEGQTSLSGGSYATGGFASSSSRA